MIDINKKQSLFALWIPTFQAVNNTIGMLLKVLALFLLPPLLLIIASAFILPHMPAAKLFFVLFTGAFYLLSCTVPAILMRQYAAYLEGRIEAISQSFSSAILSTIFIAIVWLFFGIGVALLCGLVVVLHSSIVAIVLWALLLLAYIFGVGVRIIYATQAIAVREKGPITAVEYSWQLTEGKGYFRALGMCALLMFVSLLPSVSVQVLHRLIPLYMPINFASWPWALLIALGLIVFFVMLAVHFLLLVYPVVVFINTENHLHATEWAKPASMRVVNKHAPSTVKTEDGKGEVKFDGEETIRLNAEEIQALTVKSTPVSAEGEEENLQAHLDEVFKKAPEGIAQKGDEDRMPTILFDDEMAQQLEENRKMWEKKDGKKTDDNNEDGPQSVKMSK